MTYYKIKANLGHNDNVTEFQENMLQSIKKYLTRVTTNQDEELPFNQGDERLATAALMYHLIAVDGHVDQSEKDALRTVLKKNFEIEEDDLNELIDQAKKRDEEAVDLYEFTSVLKRKLDYNERLNLMDMLWKMVFADGVLHEFEDNIIWRVSELLGVSKRDRITIRNRVAKNNTT